MAFGLAGFYETSFGVGWVFVGNLIASLLTLLAILTTTNRTLPRIDGKLLRRVLVYSLPLMVSGIAGTANEFIYPQMIKYLVPEGAMGEVVFTERSSKSVWCSCFSCRCTGWPPNPSSWPIIKIGLFADECRST